MSDQSSSAEARAAESSGAHPDRRAAAFFDMDKTLIAENSGSVYLKKRFRNGEVGVSDLATGLAAYLRYKMGVLDASESTKALMSGLQGRLESELADEGRVLCETEIVPLIYPAAAAAVRFHQDRGDLVCIVSGSLGFVVEPLGAHLAIEHTICSQVEMRDGRFTGELVKPLCFEEGKLYWLQEFIERQG
ncbi:MAG: HAD-IB family hydrolase, partial [Myxococcota bacterium]|nr:HAD-IB family hydrolase [Myxococcota bacterium]